MCALRARARTSAAGRFQSVSSFSVPWSMSVKPTRLMKRRQSTTSTCGFAATYFVTCSSMSPSLLVASVDARYRPGWPASDRLAPWKLAFFHEMARSTPCVSIFTDLHRCIAQTTSSAFLPDASMKALQRLALALQPFGSSRQPSMRSERACNGGSMPSGTVPFGLVGEAHATTSLMLSIANAMKLSEYLKCEL